ncbi:MAG: HU family DNA-binding protein [Bacteroidaceae bacterium]|nr:HU family DNA-binding protein [Bacteroidaceae bacterium]
MNNQEFIKTLTLKTGKSRKETESLLNVLLSTMSNNFIQGGSAMITNFGIFDVKKKGQRTIINPSSEKRMVIPQKMNLVFKPIDVLKDRYNAENK